MNQPRGAAIKVFLEDLDQGFIDAFGPGALDHRAALRSAATLAVEILRRTTTYYHTVEHTMLVVDAGHEIIKSKFLADGGVTPGDWLNYLWSLLFHDIGYVHGALPGDRPGEAVIDRDGARIAIPEHTTDAFLSPYHVDRGQIFVRQRFADHPLIDCELICHCIEATRFPVRPGANVSTHDWAGLVRAADLIGQMGDPDYVAKLPALFQEFEEIGANRAAGNSSPDDLRRGFPAFFWKDVFWLIGGGLHYLNLTAAGRRWRDSLFSQVFRQEHASDLGVA